MISVENLTKKLGGKKVFDDISFEVDKGQVLAIVGKRKSGKTTLMKIFAGFEIVDSGKIIIDGSDYTRNIDSIKDYVGYLPEGLVMYHKLKVSEYMKLFIEMNGLKYNNVSNVSDKLLETVGLIENKKTYIKKLTRCQQIKLTIVGLLIKNPKILLLDNPFKNLTIGEIYEVKNILKYFIESGGTVIVALEDIEIAADLNAKVIILDKGKIIDGDTYCKVYLNRKNSMENQSIYFINDTNEHNVTSTSEQNISSTSEQNISSSNQKIDDKNVDYEDNNCAEVYNHNQNYDVQQGYQQMYDGYTQYNYDNVSYHKDYNYTVISGSELVDSEDVEKMEYNSLEDISKQHEEDNKCFSEKDCLNENNNNESYNETVHLYENDNNYFYDAQFEQKNNTSVNQEKMNDTNDTGKNGVQNVENQSVYYNKENKFDFEIDNKINNIQHMQGMMLSNNVFGESTEKRIGEDYLAAKDKIGGEEYLTKQFEMLRMMRGRIELPNNDSKNSESTY